MKTLQEEIEDIRDQVEYASTMDEAKVLIKSATDLAARAVKGSAKVVDGADDAESTDDTGENYANDDDADLPAGDENTDDAGDDDAADKGEEDAPASAPAPAGQKMQKSLSEAITESGLPKQGEGFDAMPVIEAVSTGLLENNKQNFQNYDMLKSLGGIVTQLTATVTELKESVESIAGEVAAQRQFSKSASEFIDGIRRAPAGTPRANGGVPAPADAFMNKSLGGATPTDFNDEPQTLRGLTQNQLVKGLQSRLSKDDSTDTPHHGLSIEDVYKIGEVPMSSLNPKIAEVAAQELGVSLAE